MATTEHFYAGTGTQTSFPFEFPYLTESDVFVELYNSSTGNFDLKQLNTSGQNNDYSISNTNIVFNTAPPQIAGVNNIHIYRNTDVETAKAVYNTGSAIRAQDLNNNTDQALYKLQEGTQLITTGDIKDEAIDSSKIKDATIVNTDISPTAEIAVSKLADGSSRQLLQTDAAGSGVEWTSNVDVPGTLDVTGNTDLDGTLNVDGNATFQGNLNATGTTTLSTVDINGGNIDGTTIGLNTPSDVIASNLTVDNIVANHNILGTYGGYNLQLTSFGGNAYSSSGNNYAAQTTRVMENLAVDGNLSVLGSISGGSIDATTLATIPAANFVRADTSDTLTGSFYSFEGPTPNSSVVNYATLRGRDLKLEFGSGINYQAQTMQIQAQRHGIMDNNGNYASINDINLGAGNLGLPWGSTELNSNQIGHVSRISLGRAYMTVAKANNVYSTNQLVMRASYPDGLMFYHPDTATTGAEYYLSGSNMPGDATYGNSYDDNITEARNNADMRIIQGGILAKNRVEIGSSTVTGTLQISGTDVTSTATELNKLDGYTGTTTELNKLDGYTGSTADLNEVVTGKNVVETITGSATDSQLPTAQAVNERIVELVTEVGGFHPIANETSFPTTNPDINDGAGTIVSLKALTSAFSTGSGVTTHTFTNGAGSGNNVIINGLPASTTFQAGKGLLLETTSTLHTYNYHRLVLDESGVSNADALVSAFNERYYGPYAANQSTRPSGANRVNGDLYFNTSDGKMKVWNGSHASGTWDDVAAPGNFFINTLSSSSGSGGGSATFNGTATRFTLSNPPLTAQQLLVSVNGVIQKPNSGTSPSEGFAIDSADIIFASAPATGAPYFIVTIGSSVNIGTPSNDTVGAAQIIDGSISNAEISSSAAIAKSKLASLDIVNADVNASAAIAKSKLAALDIVNADVNASAAIAGTKISPDFGSQNIITSSSLSISVGSSGTTASAGYNELTIEGANEDIGMCFLSPAANNRTQTIAFGDSNNNSSGKIEYNHSTDDLTLTASNNIILSGDAVGIGTSSPIEKLQSTGAIISTGSNSTGSTTGANRSIIDLTSGGTRIGHFRGTTSAGSGSLKFFVDSSEMMQIDSDGKVGIGTTSPDSLLTLDGSTNPTISIKAGGTKRATLTADTGSSKTVLSSYDGYPLEFSSSAGGGGNTVMTLLNTGKVGIGTSSPDELLHLAGGSPNIKLHNTGSSASANDVFGKIVFQHADADDAGITAIIQCVAEDSVGNSFLAFHNGDGGNADERMRIDSSGRLLLGQTSDTDGSLCMNGVLAFSAGGNGTASTSNARPNISRGADGQLLLAAGKDSGSSIRFDVAASASTNAAEVMLINSSGNVGIGTSNPLKKLHIADAGDVALMLQTTNAVDDKEIFEIGCAGNASNHADLIFRTRTNAGSGGSEVLRLTNDGNVSIEDGNLVVASGHGIDFSATSNSSGTTSSELLDDYEEGTFTPDWQGTTTGGTTTYGQNHGSYTKIGNTVHIRIYSTIGSTTATGNWIMHNLPFIGVQSYAGITTGSCMVSVLNWHTNSSYVVPYKNSNTNDLDLYASGDNDGWRVIQISDDSNFEIILGITYQAA